MKKELSLRHRLVCAMPYILLQWLIQENLLTRFCNNVIKQCDNLNKYDYITLLENEEYIEDPSKLLIWAFTWLDTPEGRSFWNEKSDQFSAYIKSTLMLVSPFYSKSVEKPVKSIKKKNLSLRHRLICAIPYVLLHWLIQEKLLHQYCNNVIAECSILCKNEPSKGEVFLLLLEDKNSFTNKMYSQLITWAFHWENTPEGYNYWFRRHNWYKEYLESIKTIKKGPRIKWSDIENPYEYNL